MKFSFKFSLKKKTTQGLWFQNAKIKCSSINTQQLFFDEITQKFICVQIKTHFL